MYSLFFLVLTCHTPVIQPQETGPLSEWSVDQLAEAVRRREEAVENASVHTTYTWRTKENLPPGQIPTETVAELKFLVEGIWERGGRARYSMAGQIVSWPDHQPRLVNFRRELGHDGRELRIIEGGRVPTWVPSAEPGPFHGEVYGSMVKSSELAGWQPRSPWEMEACTPGIPVSRYLTDFKARARVYDDGQTFEHPVLMVECEMPPGDLPDRELKHRLWIDPGLGHVARKFVVTAKRHQDDKFHVMYISETPKWEEVQTGVWMPTEIRINGTMIPANGSPTPFDEWLIENDDWRVNQELDDEWCKLAFPKGLEIHDKRTGKEYVFGEISDLTIEEAVEKATQLFRRLPAPHPFRSGFRRWVLGGVGSVLGIALVLFGIARWSRVRGGAS